MDTFLIVDGNSLACRAILAHNPENGKDLCTSDGRVTGGVLRFFNMFDKILHQFKPSHIVICWDTNNNTLRHKLDSNYKHKRIKSQSEKPFIGSQFDYIRTILEKVGIVNINLEGYEGDDLVGTFTNKSKADNVFIITGDKDSFQLVDTNINVVYPLNGFSKCEIVDAKWILNKYNIASWQFCDYKMLYGDKSDCIDGLVGCGEKTAIKLLNEYGSVKDIIKNKNQLAVNKKIKANLDDFINRMKILEQLVTIKRDVPVNISYEDCKVKLNWNKAFLLFQDLECYSLVTKLHNHKFFGQDGD